MVKSKEKNFIQGNPYFFFHLKKIKVPSQNLCPPLKQAKQMKTQKCRGSLSQCDGCGNLCFFDFSIHHDGKFRSFLIVGAVVVSSGKGT